MPQAHDKRTGKQATLPYKRKSGILRVQRVASQVETDPQYKPQTAFITLEGLVPKAASVRELCYQGDQVSDSKMADSIQVEEPQRRAVGGTITTGRIHKGKDLDDQLYMINYYLVKRKSQLFPLL